MKRISVYFTFATAREAAKFRQLLTEAGWLDPDDDGSAGAANQVVVRIDAGNYKLPSKLWELASDARECWAGSGT